MILEDIVEFTTCLCFRSHSILPCSDSTKNGGFSSSVYRYINIQAGRIKTAVPCVQYTFMPFLCLQTMKKMTELQLQAYSKAGGVAEEVFSAIKTVVAFGGQHREIERYASRLVDARRVGLKKGFVSGIAIGVMWLAIFLSMALAFWYGMKLQREENFSGGDIIRVGFHTITRSQSPSRDLFIPNDYLL